MSITLGPGGHHPLLDPQMRRAVGIGADQRAVPAPDRAVVKLEAGKIGLVLARDRQQDRIVFEILGEDRGRVLARIAGAEGHPVERGVVARLLDRLLEDRDAGFVPQRLAEQERRIGGERDQRPAEDHRGVEIARQVFRRNLQVQLERGGRGFEHAVEMLGF